MKFLFALLVEQTPTDFTARLSPRLAHRAVRLLSVLVLCAATSVLVDVNPNLRILGIIVVVILAIWAEGYGVRASRKDGIISVTYSRFLLRSKTDTFLGSSIEDVFEVSCFGGSLPWLKIIADQQSTRIRFSNPYMFGTQEARQDFRRWILSDSETA